MGSKEFLHEKRSKQRLIWKALLICSSMASIGVTIYLCIFMKNMIEDQERNGIHSSNPLHSDQNIDDAHFDSFGRHLEPFWRSFLLANLVLILLYCFYIPFASYYRFYYPILLFIVFMFSQVILAFGTNYFSVPYRFCTLVYFINALIAHFQCHQMRLDILDEMNAIKQNSQ